MTDIVDRIVEIIESRIVGEGYISVKTVSDEIERLVVDGNHDTLVELWVRGMAVRDGHADFANAPYSDVEVAYSMAVEDSEDAAREMIVAGIRASAAEAIERVDCTERELSGELFLIRQTG